MARLPLVWLYCTIQAAFVGYAWFQYNRTGYLPIPFAYDKSDTFMDLFHPLFWSNDSGLYTIWGSVYPPLNFLLLQPLKVLISSNYQFDTAVELRSEAGLFFLWLLLVYLTIPLLVLRTRPWKTFSRLELVPVYLAIVMSTPMLFTLERGNLLLLALPFLALALTTTGTLCCLAAAFLINIKPYFAVLILVFLLARRFQDVWTITLAAGAIFLFSGILIDNQFLQFLGNIVNFSQDDEMFSVRALLSLPSSVSVYGQVLRVYYAQGGQLDLFGVNLQFLAAVVDAIKWIVLLAAFGAVFAARNMPTAILITMSIAIISNLGVSVGGYSIIFYIPLIPIFYGMGYRRFYIPAVLVMLAPLDAVGLLTQNVGEQISYLSGRLLSVDWDLAVGVFIRPPLNLALLAALSWEVCVKYVFGAATATIAGSDFDAGYAVAPNPAP